MKLQFKFTWVFVHFCWCVNSNKGQLKLKFTFQSYLKLTRIEKEAISTVAVRLWSLWGAFQIRHQGIEKNICSGCWFYGTCMPFTITGLQKIWVSENFRSEWMWSSLIFKNRSPDKRPSISGITIGRHYYSNRLPELCQGARPAMDAKQKSIRSH